MELGDVPIQDLGVVTVDPPSWLPTKSYKAWQHIWNYTPPSELANIRLEQRAYSKGVPFDGVSLSDRKAAIEGQSFLLRSLQIDASDVLVAVRVDERLEDGAFVLVWKILKTYETPIAIGPDLQN